MKKLTVFALMLIINSLLAQVAINQVGYLPNATKQVYFSSEVNSFTVRDFLGGDVLFSGECELWKKNDPATKQTIYRGEFSDFSDPGRYYIQDNKGNRSPVFGIGYNVYDDLYQKSVKSFYIQRCGMNLDEKYAGKFAHPACHTNDGTFHASAGVEGHEDVTGGWHDAGDYGKYIVNGAYSVGVMLTGYEFYPKGFQSDELDIPESGNGIPDYLDECRYELEWFLKMQDIDDGLFHKATAAYFCGMDVKPQDHKDTRYIIQKTSTATADFAAVMAKAARVYNPYDRIFSIKCKNAAERAWKWLEKHPTIVPDGGYRNPEGINTGDYGDGNDLDERLWAAVELYITTGDEKYNQFYQEKIGDAPKFDELFSWNTVQNLAHINYLKLVDNKESKKTHNLVKKEFEKYCKALNSKIDDSGYRVVLGVGDYSWGSCQVALNSGFMLLVGADIFNDKHFLKAGFDQIHFNLGVNSMNMTYVTGMGTKYPKTVHNRGCSLTDNWEVFPGFLVGGPNQFLQDNSLKEHFTKDTPPAQCYLDIMESYASNEICINWNAILVVYAGYLKGIEQ